MIIYNKRDRTKHAYIPGLTAIALSILALWYFYSLNSVENVSPVQQNNQYTQLRAADRLQTVKGLPPCDSASIPEFDSSRHFRKSALNEINNLEAIFAFSCGGTFL